MRTALLGRKLPGERPSALDGPGAADPAPAGPAAPGRSAADPGSFTEPGLARPAGRSAPARPAVALRHARAAARFGRYAEAEALLNRYEAACGKDLRSLDLRARICAQQGRLGDAEALWLRAAKLAPSSVPPRDGIQAVARVRGRTRRAVGVRVVVLGAAVGFVVLQVAVLVRLGGVRDDAAARAELARSVSTAATAVAALRADVVALRRAAEGAERGVQTLGSLRAAARMPGVELRDSPTGVAIVFARGLFAKGTVLRPGGAALLAALGRRLEPLGDRVRLHVIGHTDSFAVPGGRPYRDNEQLALSRAQVALRGLRARADLPARALLIGSAGNAGTPFAGDTRRGRAANRTAVIHVEAVGS